MSIFDEHDLTAEERAAIADEPRPGVWREDNYAGAWAGERKREECGDGRPFTQDETDCLIVFEITMTRIEASASAGAFDPWRRSVHVEYGNVTPRRVRPAHSQRGGIHSDPLVRLLAFRVWGNRDRRWFDEQENRRRAIDDLARLLAVAPSARIWTPPHAKAGDYAAGFDEQNRIWTAVIAEVVSVDDDGSAIQTKYRLFTSSIQTH